jgi:indolepyruvate ferredoxin oxidoreductase, beta subunit
LGEDVKQRIVISGRGGQGVLTLTRVVAETAAEAGHEVITTETHGMAQRGGAVLSTIKVGAFHGPLIAPGEAEVGLFLHADNLAVHGHYLRPGGASLVNASSMSGHDAVDADRLAALAGQPRAANLALLGYAAGKGVLFTGPDVFEETIRKTTPARHLDQNLAAFRAGVEASR